MGQEASVPRNNDEAGETQHQAPPQGGRSPTNAADANATAAAVVSPSVAAGGVGLAGGGGISTISGAQYQQHQPQSQQQQQHGTQAMGSSTPPPLPQHASTNTNASPQPQQGGSSSLMSRAGITSMIQRMGGSGRSGMRSPITPPRGGAVPSPADNNGYHSPRAGQSDSIHHQDLSPDSKARQQAMMMKKQQQEHQQYTQQNHPPFSTQQSSPSFYTASEAGSNAGEQRGASPSTAQTVDMSNVSGNRENDGGESSIAQRMTNLSLSGQLPRPPQPKTPPSPRQALLKKMQNNDEEDWQKAWEEDSESDDEDEEGGRSSAKPPSFPQLEPPGAMAGGQNMGQPVAPSPLPHRPDMDGGHSSASVQALPPRNSAMHSAFTPPKPQPPPRGGQPRQGGPPLHGHPQQQAFIGNQKAIAVAPPGIKSPIITYADEDARLVREANEALRGEDGRQHWDSYAAEDIEEKPNVDMFDPALRVLGRGSFGRVVLVQKQHGIGTGSLYAMKILRKSHLVRRRQIERTKTERKVLSMLDHPFIMKMYYAFQTTEKLFLVLDYCPGGELFFHLSRYRRFQEPVARFYAAELLLAIGHLHKNGIIYRDLKPENVLLDAYGHVKLGDFGLAKYGIRHPTQGAKSTCGTPEYMAPEVLNQSGHGFCVDYWGLGMILYEMMTGLPPWYTTDRSKLFRRLRSAPLIFPNEVHFSPHCKACIAGLLDREPRMRLGVMGLRSAMRHEFFYRRINFEALRARQIAAPIRPCEGWRQFQSRSSSMASDNDSDHPVPGGPGGWHSLDSAAMGGISAEALDVATANFDDSFRRMPIETEDYETQQQAAGHPPISEKDLNEETFRGFTFDGDLPTEGNNHTTHNSPGRPSPGHRASGGGLV